MAFWHLVMAVSKLALPVSRDFSLATRNTGSWAV